MLYAKATAKLQQKNETTKFFCIFLQKSSKKLLYVLKTAF